MKACRVCGSDQARELLDFGEQPLCNRFLRDVAEKEYTHPLTLGLCGSCGLVQLLNDPVPVHQIRPRFEWITYREPEGHLDALADTLVGLVGSPGDAAYVGVSFKDDSLLARLRSRDASRTWRIHPETDLGIQARGVGVESIQDRLDSTNALELVERHGSCDVMIARHILEHAYDVGRFMEAARKLLKPGGLLVLEVPDCTRSFETRDFTTVWEEHTLYFTPHTFQSFCVFSGLEILQFDVIPYPLENSIVGVVRFKQGEPSRMSEEVLNGEKQRALAFAGDFGPRRNGLRRWLADFQMNRGKIAILGAGHLTCTFINLFGLSEHLEFVADDDPNKQGLFMPGSRLPIRGSKALRDEGILLCLLGVNPEHEEALVRRQASFVEAGGILRSIFFASPRGPRV